MNSHIPENLRCEYEKNPLGVQKSQPLLSWQVREEAAPESGWQQAYQIVASSKESLLSEGIYDRWDSGIVKSRRSYAIPYQGTALKSSERIYWMVRIQDQSGEFSPFSKAAWFEMGLLNDRDWKGNWMSFLGGLIGNGLLMRYSFSCQQKRIVRARAYVCCLGYHELHLNGSRIGDHLLDPAPTDCAKTVLYTTYDVTENLLPEEIHHDKHAHPQKHGYVVYDHLRLRRQYLLHKRLCHTECDQIAHDDIDSKPPGQSSVLILYFESHPAVGMVGEDTADKIRDAAGKPVVHMHQIVEHCHDDPPHQSIDHTYQPKVDHLHNKILIF